MEQPWKTKTGMDTVFEWLNPLNWLAWLQESPLLALVIGVPLAPLLILRLVRGGIGVRQAVANVAGIGLILWGTLWFANWVQPSLKSGHLFTPPVVGPQAVTVVLAKQKTIERIATYAELAGAHGLLGGAEQAGGHEPLTKRELGALVERRGRNRELLTASVALVHAGGDGPCRAAS